MENDELNAEAPTQPTYEWDESFFERCRIVSNGWGRAQPPNAGSGAPGPARTPMTRGSSGNASYDGPVNTWPTYRAITPSDWAVFNDHGILFSDGVNIPGMEPGWLVCGLCNNKKAVTKDLMQMHIDSTKHKRNYEWQKTTSALAAANPSQEPNNPVPKIAIASSSAGGYTPDDKTIIEENFCEVSADGWIVCTLCDKKCMDMGFLTVHIESSRHKKRMEWMIPTIQAGSISDEEIPPGIVLTKEGFYCTYCGAAEMSSGQVVRLHVDGERHKKNTPGASDENPSKQVLTMRSGAVNLEVDPLSQVPMREGIRFKNLVAPWTGDHQNSDNSYCPPEEINDPSPNVFPELSEEVIDI